MQRKTRYPHLLMALPLAVLLILNLGFLLLGGCSTQRKPADEMAQDKNRALGDPLTTEELLAELSGPDGHSGRGQGTSPPHFDWPDKDITAQAAQDIPQKVYEIAVLLPFSSAFYKNIAQEALQSLTISMFQNESMYTRCVLRPIDTGTTAADFSAALKQVQELQPQVVIGPIVTQNVLELMEQAKDLPQTQFLPLNANPELLSVKKPQNVWLMGNAITNELPLLETGRSDQLYTVVLPNAVDKEPLLRLLRSLTKIPLEAIHVQDVGALSPGARLYLPLKLDLSAQQAALKAHKRVFGFNWQNQLPPEALAQNDFKVFTIQTLKPIPSSFDQIFLDYLGHPPTSLDMLAFTAFEVALQLLEQPAPQTANFGADLAYKTLMGTVYITPDGYAHFGLQARPYAHSWPQEPGATAPSLLSLPH